MTEIMRTMADWRLIEASLRQTNKTLGLVPTMGHLHVGHESLIRRSLSENDITVLSVFVNPKQFNRQQDYDHYPITLDEDLAMAKKMGVDYMFVPDPDAMYPCDYDIRMHDVTESKRMEGLHRPGHFEGMLTIVMKLFTIFMPDHAYFGEKDYQQYVLVDRMARAFFLKTTVVPCPTVRDEYGVAYSSRNSLLGQACQQKLRHFSESLSQPGSSEGIKKILLNHGFEVEYVDSCFGRRFAAVKLDGVRLIDNVVLQEQESLV